MPIEVARYCTPESGVHDPMFASYHAVCAASLDDLLNPGAVEAAGSPLLQARSSLGAETVVGAGSMSGAGTERLTPCVLMPPVEAPVGSKPVDEAPLPDGACAWTYRADAPATDAAATPSLPSTMTFTLLLSKPLLAPFAHPTPAQMSVADLLPKVALNPKP